MAANFLLILIRSSNNESTLGTFVDSRYATIALICMLCCTGAAKQKDKCTWFHTSVIDKHSTTCAR